MVDKELETKVKELREYQRLADDLDSQIKALELEIKNEMEVRGVTEIITSLFKVRWTKVISNRFDSSSFKVKYAELYSQFTKAVESRRFSIV